MTDAPSRTSASPRRSPSPYEIMAPAGSWESLSAALQAGADAVYFGMGSLNMRSLAAKTFSLEDLPEIVRRSREAGVRTYLTVNTVLYDEDLPLMREILERAKAEGVSAVILSDAAALTYAQAIGLEAHLSTQLNISNVEALRFYAQFADVFVPARELRLEQIGAIAEAIRREGITGPSGKPVQIEAFCHGALCMAVSGKCHLSTHTRGKSANRGECLQNCRRTYRLVDAERGIEIDVEGRRFLSPKDLKTIGFMDRMVAAGVTVFKIEGRARGPEYVRTTVECYREALDAVLEGRWTEAMRTAWDERLARVFNRGFWDGWYLGAETMETTKDYGSSATEKKVYVGKCLNYFARSGIGHFRLEAGTLRKGDRYLVTGPTTGAVYGNAEAMRVNESEAENAEKGAEITFRVPERIREHDRLYRLDSAV